MPFKKYFADGWVGCNFILQFSFIQKTFMVYLYEQGEKKHLKANTAASSNP